MADRLQNSSLADAVTEQLISMIREGTYRAGDRLPTERELAEEFGVGRTSVREGLGYLDKLGILEIRQGRGMVVRSLSLQDVFGQLVTIPTIIELPDKEIRDIMHARRILELESSFLAAKNATEEQLSQLEDLLGGMERSLGSPKEFLKLDLTFHVVIAEASGNMVLAQLIKLLRDIYIAYSEIILRDPEINRTSLEFHRQLYSAIHQRDAHAAKEHMQAHLCTGERDVLNVLHSPLSDGRNPPIP